VVDGDRGAGEGATESGAEGGADDVDLGSAGFREPGIEEQRGDAEERGLRTAEELNEAGVLETVYFAFDSSKLSDAAIAKLAEHAEFINNNPRFRVVIEGHCDERGTTEYNLALGARRAASVREHLVRLGVPPAKLETMSWGEERPALPGHGERAWSKNRRVEFRLEEL
jgi:peptidoglycan-associated lipoprotein